VIGCEGTARPGDAAQPSRAESRDSPDLLFRDFHHLFEPGIEAAQGRMTEMSRLPRVATEYSERLDNRALPRP